MRKQLLTLGIVAAAIASGSGAAGAASRLLWGNSNGSGSLAFASLDGASGGTFAPFPAAPVATPLGLAFDSVGGRLYWANHTSDPANSSIGWSFLDGSGGGVVAVVNGATVNRPYGLAIDPVGRRLYWANQNDDTIAWAGLDGLTGGAVIVPNGAHVLGPRALAVDPVGRRLYWTNGGSSTIGFADLDDPGGGSMTTPVGAPSVLAANGLAFDPASKRLYWTSADGIGFVNVTSPSDGGSMTIPPGATANFPSGETLDPLARRLYWVDLDPLAPQISPAAFSYADLDAATPTGGTLTIPVSAPVSAPQFPLLLLAPHPDAPPVVTGGTDVGAALSCSQGGWAAESPATYPYRAPQSFAFQWSRDGTDIAGATATLTASVAGDYRCTVTADNGLAKEAQTSAAHAVGTPGGTGTNTGTGTGTGTGSGTGTNTGTGTGGGTGTGSGTGTGTGTGGSHDRTPPALSRVQLAKRKPAVVRGTVLRFVSSEAGRLSIVVERVKPGRKAKSRGKLVCKAVRKAVKRGRCKVYARVATLTRTIKAGRGSVALSGRIGSKAMAPGVYRITVTARDAAGNVSKAVRLTFTILAG